MPAQNTPFSGSPKFTGSYTVDPASMTNSSFLDVSVTAPGFLKEHMILAGMPLLETGILIVGAACKVNGTVIVRLHNTSGGTVDPASQTVNLIAL